MFNLESHSIDDNKEEEEERTGYVLMCGNLVTDELVPLNTEGRDATTGIYDGSTILFTLVSPGSDKMVNPYNRPLKASRQ